jgi:hypothetical protein
MIYQVTVYKDKKDCLLLIPNARTDAGFSVGINKPTIMEYPYDNVSIGEKVRESLKICTKEPIYSSKNFIKVYEVVTGIKSFSKFSKDRLALEVFMDMEKGFIVLPLVRHSDGSYRPSNERYPDVKLDLNATNEQIGEAIQGGFELLIKEG